MIGVCLGATSLGKSAALVIICDLKYVVFLARIRGGLFGGGGVDLMSRTSDEVDLRGDSEIVGLNGNVGGVSFGFGLGVGEGTFVVCLSERVDSFVFDNGEGG